jgi:hypothetical protein
MADGQWQMADEWIPFINHEPSTMFNVSGCARDVRVDNGKACTMEETP